MYQVYIWGNIYNYCDAVTTAGDIVYYIADEIDEGNGKFTFILYETSRRTAEEAHTLNKKIGEERKKLDDEEPLRVHTEQYERKYIDRVEPLQRQFQTLLTGMILGEKGDIWPVGQITTVGGKYRLHDVIEPSQVKLDPLKNPLRYRREGIVYYVEGIVFKGDKEDTYRIYKLPASAAKNLQELGKAEIEGRNKLAAKELLCGSEDPEEFVKMLRPVHEQQDKFLKRGELAGYLTTTSGKHRQGDIIETSKVGPRPAKKSLVIWR